MAAQPGCQRWARTVRSDKKANWADLAGFVDGDNVGMFQSSHGAGLALEALAENGTIGHFGARHLQGDQTIQHRIRRQIDDAEPTAPQLAVKLKAAEPLPWGRHGIARRFGACRPQLLELLQKGG